MTRLDRTGPGNRRYSVSVAFRFLLAAKDWRMVLLVIGPVADQTGWAEASGDVVRTGTEIEAVDERSAIQELRRRILAWAEEAGCPAEWIVFLEERADLVE